MSSTPSTLVLDLKPMTLDQAKALIRRLLGSYPQASATDPEVYVTSLITLLVGYPLWVGERAIDKVLDTSKFLPTRADIKPVLDECDPRRREISDWDNRVRGQLEERRQIEARRGEGSPEHRAAVVDRIRAEMAKAGMPFERDRERVDPDLAAADFKAQHGISDAQWDALPTRSDTWKRAG